MERVDLASQGRVEVLAADFYMNGTVHAGVAAPVSDQVRKLTRIQPKNKVYLTLTFGEGDNMQYCQRRMREIWDDPRRGEAPVDWTVSPLLSDIGPGLLSYYRTGMDLVYAYNYRENNQWVPFSEALGRSYADLTPVRGIIQSWETGDLLVDRGGIPVIGNFSPAGKAAEYKAALVAHIAGWDGKAPLFIAGGINAWSWTPSDIAELAGLLADPFELIRGDTFFDVLHRTF